MAKKCAFYLTAYKWQKKSLHELHVHNFEMNYTSTYDAVVQRFKGLSLTEAIIQFGRMAKIYRTDDIKAKLLEEQKKYVFSSMCECVLLNDQGQSVGKLPSITETVEEEDSSAMMKHMVHYVSEQRRLSHAIPLRIAYQLLCKYGPIKEEDLDFLLLDNLIVPNSRVDIIKQGLCMGLNGNIYAAMHILQPQTENIFRDLVQMCGDTVTFLEEDGTERYKPLSSLFKSKKLRECYDENILFTFYSIMDDPVGENLRNLISHGLLEPERGDSDSSLYFLSLLIFLLSLYTEKAWSILVNLVKCDRLDTDKEKTGKAD